MLDKKQKNITKNISLYDVTTKLNFRPQNSQKGPKRLKRIPKLKIKKVRKQKRLQNESYQSI